MEEITARMRRGIESDGADKTAAVAFEFARALPEDCLVTLSGDLGAGKTTFVKGLAAGLGVKETVKSPSFNICSVYDTADGRRLVHIDAYRLSAPEDFDNLLLDEIAPSPKVVCVEWPEAVAEALEPDYRLKLDILPNGSHFIKLL